MILSKPQFFIQGIESNELFKSIENAGRVCYNSEEKYTLWGQHKFIKNLIECGHESVLEHEKVTVRIICDCGISHQLVRHRIVSYPQESTRFCNYKGGVEFIIPPWVIIPEGTYTVTSPVFCTDDPEATRWYRSMQNAEKDYMYLLNGGWLPQQARSVLPNSLKTEIVITQNIRQWRDFFKLRALGVSGKPHPQMLEITVPMLQAFKDLIPVLFDDLE